MSNLVIVFKKPHAQQPLGLRADTAPRVAEVDISSWPRLHFFHRSKQSCAGTAAVVAEVTAQRDLPFGLSAGANVRGGKGRQAKCQGKEHRNVSFQIKKKTAVYTQLFVLVQYKQNKKSLLLMVSKHPILKRRGDAQQVD